jgi:hypothetical protein
MDWWQVGAGEDFTVVHYLKPSVGMTATRACKGSNSFPRWSHIQSDLARKGIGLDFQREE